MTFSRGLALYLAGRTGCEVRRVRLVVGPSVPEGLGSPTGLYAVCKTNRWPLRVTLFREAADLWRHETRDVRVCWLDGPGDPVPAGVD